MTIKRITENPRTSDTIIFDIKTPDADGFFALDPYKVESVTVYFIERDFSSPGYGQLDRHHDNPGKIAALELAEKNYRQSPTDENLIALEEAKIDLEATRVTTTYYYKDQQAIHTVGSSLYPAWLSTDQNSALITHITTDDDGYPLYGNFQYEWQPKGSARPGDYVICWKWMPNPSGGFLAAHDFFTLDGDPNSLVTIPTHLTAEEKYETLLERYLPEMYKNVLCDIDMTPETLFKLNKSVAMGFTFLEDMANQIIDLFDANALHESMLMYLSNLFNLKLRSSDPTLWRRQIKEAVPLFKKKGTLEGLKQAFSQAGMSLDKYTQYWQIVSPYTWQESFRVASSPTFELEKSTIILPPVSGNFGVWLRAAGTDDYVEVDDSSVEFEIGDDFVVRMTWVGEDLYEGDIVRVLYQYENVPSSTEQSQENYIRSLPLADQRDEADQLYPPKNWNVRLIDEDDPMFSVLVPVRHPFYDPLIFGHIRTEFAYSENIYNMDEYNGSLRPSTNPCHIDRDFADPCGSCLSSIYSLDLTVRELTNDRMLEAQDILREHMPFHAQLHSISFSGEFEDTVASPIEDIDVLVMVDMVSPVISGEVNASFTRSMEGGLNEWIIDREDLADKNTVLSGKQATGYNDEVVLVSHDVDLDALGVVEDKSYLEILAPSVNAGTYEISAVRNNTAVVRSGVSEPLDTSMFTFNLSNTIYSNSVSVIHQDDVVKFSDASKNFATIGVRTQWDVDYDASYTGDAWKVLIPAYSSTAYTIEEIRDGILHLSGDSNLPITTTTNITYSLLNDSDVVQTSSNSGRLEIQRRGRVDLNDEELDTDFFIRIGDYLIYDGQEYQIIGREGQDIYIKNWTLGGVGGARIVTRRRLVNRGQGSFGYRGMYLATTWNHETEFGIVNGTNPPENVADDNHFMENYLIRIGSDYYKIIEWDGTIIRLEGREQSWGTSTAGGSLVAYAIMHFPKKAVTIQLLPFDHLDRSGQDVVVREIYDQVSQNTAIAALSANRDGGIQEIVNQEEGFSFVIQRRDGSVEQGEV